MKTKDSIHHFLKMGLSAHAKGQLDFAGSLYEKALNLDPENTVALDLLGVLSTEKGEPEKAIQCFEKVLSLKPDNPDARFNLATHYSQSGNTKEAIRHLRLLLKQDPQIAQVHKALGFLYYVTGEYDLAVTYNRQAITLSPEDFELYYNLGIVYQLWERWDDAVRCYEKAISLNPAFHMAHNNLGTLFYDKKDYKKAKACYARTIALEPNNDLGYMNLAKICQEQGEMKEARDYYLKSNAIRKKDCIDLVLALMLPPIYSSQEEAEKDREKLMKDLDALRGKTLSIPNPLRHLGIPNFYSAYHEYDEKELQVKISNLFKPLFDSSEKTTIRKTRREKIHIGFLSKHLKDHTIGKLMRGIIARLSRKEFYVTALSVGRHDDPIANFIKENSDRYLVLPNNIQHGAKIIRDVDLDILFYTDIGMDPLTFYLSFQRLAPVQCLTWGHPVTTGREPMDYFISSELIEPENGEEHYTEKLVKLKTINMYYYRPEIPDVLKGRVDFGLPEKANLYLCPQTLMKIHPDFDAFIAGILRGDPQGIFILIKATHDAWTHLLEQRFKKNIPDVQDRIVFVDRMPYGDFINLVALSDVLLDPIYFGGGNTSYEAFATGAPIVTLPGKYMRSRLTYGQYRLMGMMDCVAKNKDEYIGLAVRLGTDKNYRRDIRRKIQEKNHSLYEDDKAIEELEQFFKSAVSKAF